jgi:hypothetical protein
MQVIGGLVAFVLSNTLLDFSLWSALAVGIWIAYLINFVVNINKSIAFREYILMMYGLNYLLSPALTYEITQKFAIYKMKLAPEVYFSLAIPGMLCLHLGLYAIKTKIFKPDFQFSAAQKQALEPMLMQWLIGGVAVYFIRPFVPGDLAFLLYLLSGIRYLAAMGLFLMNRKKYKWYLLGLLFLEVSRSLSEGMFHDMTVWLLFFGILWAYLNKPNPVQKLVLGIVAFLFFFILQSTKETYRTNLRTTGSVGLDAFTTAVSEKNKMDKQTGGLFNIQNLSNTITRANQGWIFASSVNRMQYRQDYQGLELIKKYAEAAFLPRALAPNKLEAGDIAIFNQFSGVRILRGTSMGLGLFADGFIAYGSVGVWLFCFAFGLLCAYCFKIIEGWSKISIVFVLFIFPLLNFAVRADCETQTWMGHIVKGLLVFALLVFAYKKYIARKTAQNEFNNEAEPMLMPATTSV